MSTGILWANVAVTIAVIAVNLYQSKRGWIVSRWVSWSVAMVAAAYCAGYVALATDHVEVLAWSEFFRTFSLTAWPITGMAYPLALLSMRRSFTKRIKEKADAVDGGSAHARR